MTLIDIIKAIVAEITKEPLYPDRHWIEAHVKEKSEETK